MAAVLTDFLARAAGEPHRFGEWDCCMFLANWDRERTGIDPAARLRGTYSTRAGWMRTVLREGGLVRLVRRLAIDAGMAEVVPDAAGDIAICEVEGVGRAGAIFTGKGFVFKFDNGLTRAPAVPLTGWRRG